MSEAVAQLVLVRPVFFEEMFLTPLATRPILTWDDFELAPGALFSHSVFIMSLKGITLFLLIEACLAALINSAQTNQVSATAHAAIVIQSDADFVNCGYVQGGE